MDNIIVDLIDSTNNILDALNTALGPYLISAIKGNDCEALDTLLKCYIAVNRWIAYVEATDGETLYEIIIKEEGNYLVKITKNGVCSNIEWTGVY